MTQTKVSTHFRLTPQAITGLERLAQKRGLNRTAYLEILVRQHAAEEGIDVEKVLTYLDRRNDEGSEEGRELLARFARENGPQQVEQEDAAKAAPSVNALANHKRNQRRKR